MGTDSRERSARIPLLSIGHGNFIVAERVNKLIPIRMSQPLLTRRIRNEAKQESLLVNCSQGKAARTVIVLNSGHIVLTSKDHQAINKALMDGRVVL